MVEKKDLRDVLGRLSDLSVEHVYDPYHEFEWPPSIPEDRLWMSKDLMSFYGTPYMEDLTDQQLYTLSRWELVNFFSFNVHGIRDLMLHVLSRIHTTEFAEESEYFHHFLDEENKHMWFFAQFCLRYGGNIYFTQKMQFPAFEQEDIQSFVSFAKILISEQVSDFYNTRMMADETLPPIIRKVNRVHHEDETRHIAMGLHLVREMHERLMHKYDKDVLARIGDYLRRYMNFFVESFYNPKAYLDAGFKHGYELRKSLISHPARQEFHKQVLGNTSHYFEHHALMAEA